MRIKAIKDLCQRTDAELFAELAEGCPLLLAHAEKTWATATTIKETDPTAARMLTAFVSEEAAKVLILVDVVRCPRLPGERFARQLKRFNDHLAKGIYESAYQTRPATFGELHGYIDLERRSHYLDGPNDIDWIFENEVTTNRESTLYVDYGVDDSGQGRWLDPRRFDGVLEFGVLEPETLRVVRAMRDVGMLSAEALAVIAAVWRPVSFADDTKWTQVAALTEETFAELDRLGLLVAHADALARISESWTYPLQDCEMKELKVPIDGLRAVRSHICANY